jgi:ABC-type multidrug transport system ATPase subunit
MNCLSLEFEPFTNLHFFYNWMNAEEYLLHFAALYKIQPQLVRKRANDLLEKVGLASKSFAPIGYYSRGMKQRLGLARALVNNPKIIFLDEPTLGLDPKDQQDIQKLLLDLNHEKEVTVFLSSHVLSEVSSLCNRIAIVNHGRLVVLLSPSISHIAASASNPFIMTDLCLVDKYCKNFHLVGSVILLSLILSCS